MRPVLTVYPVRRLSIARLRRKGGGRYNRMLGKLDAAAERLERARRRH